MQKNNQQQSTYRNTAVIIYLEYSDRCKQHDISVNLFVNKWCINAFSKLRQMKKHKHTYK